ncbi:zinc finger MYM-type protein 1-like [Daktulosphaira vitifoliae]|uniref:zinc finger MYM-type protein 1-like n=1 Tax=Daktulosphaira vitifoliae TaxID=58002 RepID=UPI0021AA63C9|nr:zinc finger MYM-type protein 1-like [Daktulosphaira vitifoliae]
MLLGTSGASSSDSDIADCDLVKIAHRKENLVAAKSLLPQSVGHVTSHNGTKQHDKSILHKLCMTKWEGYKMTEKTGKSVLTLINRENETVIKENRYYIATVAEILLFTACQNIAQRGDNESSDSMNKGNFLELLCFCAKRDTSIKSQMVIESIANELQKSKYFSILADETKDLSKTEQLSVMIRYFYNNTVNERFLGYVPCSELHAKALFEFIKITLSACGINIQNCIAQTYDGASVMSGTQNGVQAIFQKEVPKALYTHCYNHRLNLVIVDVCKNVPKIEKIISLLQQLYNFINRSTVHMAFLGIQKELFPKKNTVELKKLCDTRWICQISACIAVRETFSVILAPPSWGSALDPGPFEPYAPSARKPLQAVIISRPLIPVEVPGYAGHDKCFSEKILLQNQ